MLSVNLYYFQITFPYQFLISWVKVAKIRMKHLISGERQYFHWPNVLFSGCYFAHKVHFMGGFIYYFHSALEHKSRVQNEKKKTNLISRVGTVLFTVQVEFKTFSVPKWHKKKRYLGIIWVPRRLWRQSLLLCLGLGQKLWHSTNRGLSDLRLLSMKFTFLVQKRAEPGILLYPILRAPHTCCTAESPLSLGCPSHICRELCVQVQLQVLLQQHTSSAEVSRLMHGVQDPQIDTLYYSATHCLTPSSPLIMTNSCGWTFVLLCVLTCKSQLVGESLWSPHELGEAHQGPRAAKKLKWSPEAAGSMREICPLSWVSSSISCPWPSSPQALRCSSPRRGYKHHDVCTGVLLSYHLMVHAA